MSSFYYSCDKYRMNTILLCYDNKTAVGKAKKEILQ